MDRVKKIGLLALLVVCGKESIAQSVATMMGGRSAGLAYASATLHDEWSLLNNAGGLSKINQPAVAFACERRPGLIGANRIAAIFSTPVPSGTAGIGLFRFGDDVYNEQKITLGYGHSVGTTSIGLSVNYVQYMAAGFGSRRAVSLNFGGISQLTPQISVGALILNLNQPKLSTIDGERLPTRVAAGIAFQPNANILLLTEIEKDLDYDPVFKAALEYTLHKKVTFRTGFNVHPDAAFLGLGYLQGKLKIDYAIHYTPITGAAHQASVIYRIEKTRKHHEK